MKSPPNREAILFPSPHSLFVLPIVSYPEEGVLSIFDYTETASQLGDGFEYVVGAYPSTSSSTAISAASPRRGPVRVTRVYPPARAA